MEDDEDEREDSESKDKGRESRWSSPSLVIKFGNEVFLDPFAKKEESKKPTSDADKVRNFIRKKRHAPNK